MTAYSWANAQAAYYGMESSLGAYYPTIGINLVGSAINNKFGSGLATVASEASQNVGAIPIKTNFLLEEVTLSWLLLDFGGRDATVEAAKQALISSNWTHNYTLQEVVNNVVQAYYQAVTTDDVVAANRASLADALETEKSARAQFEAGINNLLDLLQAEANRWKAELALQQSLGDRASAYANVSEAAGLPPETKLDLIPLPRDLSWMRLEESLCDYIARARLDRDDLLALVADYRQAGAKVDVARSALFPQIVGSMDLQNFQFQARKLGDSHSYNTAIALNWTIFDGFSNTYDLYQAKAKQRAAYASWKEQEQAIVLAVIQAYYQFETAEKNLKSAREYLHSAQEAYNAASLGYKAGLNNIIDLLNAQSTLASARSQEIQSRSQLLTASANLSFATGSLYQSDCP
jgi:outer membrane protein TolC